MCGVCGCADPNNEVSMTDPATGSRRRLRDGASALAAAHALAHAQGLPHDHSHGQVHDHPHDHPHDHVHDHPHEHVHDHAHGHGDGTTHAHPHRHVHSHPHDHGHGHDHVHDHPHEHVHDHAHGHGDGTTHARPHRHVHGHPHDHGHGHDHTHGHPHEHVHEHLHDHGHHHLHPPAPSHAALHAPPGDGRTIALEAAILGKNDAIAARNRGWFEGRGVLALNLVSSPGAGKTALLEATIRALKDRVAIHVIEGDQMTTNDADRIRAAGAPAIQINTGAGCHLEADMVAEAVRALDPAPGSLLLIENVGNLVCPAMFDLGEAMKVAVVSTTEGEDKPLKYPHMFRAVGLVVINKTDLAPHTGFDEAAARANIAAVNPEAEIIALSARTGANLSAWTDRLLALLDAAGRRPAP